jgi:phosphoglycerate dehydrogenase-like enzyme
MNVVGCDTAAIDIERLTTGHGFSRVDTSFAEAVADADYVSLHIPSVAETRHFISHQRLERLGTHTWLINTARGAVVDEAALFDALAGGRLAGAALDVFEHEPYRPLAAGKDLRTLSNVIMTPHIGSSTHEACDRMARRALANIRLAEAGRFGEMDLLNPSVLDSAGADES